MQVVFYVGVQLDVTLPESVTGKADCACEQRLLEPTGGAAISQQKQEGLPLPKPVVDLAAKQSQRSVIGTVHS